MDNLMWLVTAAAIVGAIGNVRHRRWGFAVWIVTNACWLAYDLAIGANAQAALFAVYAGLAIWGWLSWGGKPNASQQSSSSPNTCHLRAIAASAAARVESGPRIP